MKNTDIQNIYFRNNNASALYQGTSLLWKKEELTGLLRGKFTDDSTEADWWIMQGATDDYGFNGVKTYISNFVNPETKEFALEINSSDKNLQCLFNNNYKLERIYELPITNETTSLFKLFYGCTSLIEVPSFANLKNINNMTQMFFNVYNVKEIDLSNIKINESLIISSMFMNNYINNLVTIKLSNWDFTNVIDKSMEIVGIFNNKNFEYLENIIGPIYNYNWNVNMISSRRLTTDSAMVLINGLADIDGTRTIQFNISTFNTLTEEQIAIATAKGWSVIRS